MPAAHCCLPCATAGRRCTDPKLPSMAARQGLETTLLYRRILATLVSVTKVTKDVLCTRLGVAKNVAAAAFKRLQQDGIIGEDMAVNKEHLQTVALPKDLGRGRAAKRSREAADDVAALVEGAGDMRIAEERAKRRKVSKAKDIKL